MITIGEVDLRILAAIIHKCSQIFNKLHGSRSSLLVIEKHKRKPLSIIPRLSKARIPIHSI